MYLWYQYKKTILISLTVIVLGLLAFGGYNLWSRPVFEVQAVDLSATNLVRGWMWTETVGWISMSCLDTNQCGDEQSRYGVRYDETTGLTGFAWSSNVGWVAFGMTTVCSSDHGRLCNASSPCSMGDTCDNHVPVPDDYSFNSHCTISCTAGTNCTACYNEDDHSLYGWAKVASLGDDGWIRLDDNNTSDSYDWGIKVKNDTDENTHGDFYGWAWNGGTFDPGTLADSIDDTGTRKGLGWLSFNSSDTESPYNYYVTGKPTKPIILSVERTEGEDTSSLTVYWNDDVLGETDFKVAKTDDNGSNFVLLSDTNLYSDDTWYTNAPLSLGQKRGYKIKACNIFGCNTSLPVYGSTSPIAVVSASKIDSDCFTTVDYSSQVNLEWSQPLTDFDRNGTFEIYPAVVMSAYEVEFCVLKAGETRDKCDGRWQPAKGGCGTIDGDIHKCHDVLNTETDNNRYNERYNIHIYRIRAVGPIAESECNGGTNTGTKCSKDAGICDDPAFCELPKSSWSYFREIRPCPKAGQPDYQEVRPQ